MPTGLSPNNKLAWTWPPPPPAHMHTRTHALTHTHLMLSVLGCILQALARTVPASNGRIELACLSFHPTCWGPAVTGTLPEPQSDSRTLFG